MVTIEIEQQQLKLLILDILGLSNLVVFMLMVFKVWLTDFWWRGGGEWECVNNTIIIILS